MLCRKCKREIPEYSIFCLWCGVRLVKEKQEISVPAPRQLASGNWTIQLRKEGVSVTEESAEKATAKAKAIRAGYIKQEKRQSVTLANAIDTYLENNSATLSPSTLRTYRIARNSAFSKVMSKDVNSINWQAEINKAASTVHPKTLRNNYGLCVVACKAQGIILPPVNLPKVPKKEKAFIDANQIRMLLDAVRDKPCETTVLLGLHSLRRSEMLALNWEDIHDGAIHVHGAVVVADGGLTYKQTNKNDTSTRTIPIMIDRLSELKTGHTGKIITSHANTAYKQINSICGELGLPLIGVHGLRHSFLTLAFSLRWNESTAMAVGGWADMTTVNAVYRHLSLLDKNDDVERMKEFYK